MAWPGSDVSRTNTDSSTDSPASARADIDDLIVKFNQVRNHLTTFGQSLVDDADASAALTTLGVTTFIKTLLDDADAATARTTLGLAIGTNVQAWDTDLDALAAMGNGLAARTGAGAYSPRTITGTANQISVSNGDGVSGNPTLSLPSAITLPGSLTMGGLLDLGSTGQIQFPATLNASGGANVLDDYEEGSWTPSLGGTTTYTVQLGQYVKVGRLFMMQCQITVNTIGTGSTTTITGGPLGPDGINGAFACVTGGSATNITGAELVYTGSLVVFSRTAASASSAANAFFQNGTTITASGTFRVAN